MDKEPLKTESEESSIEELYSQLINLLPKIVAVFTPSNRSEQEEKFLSGEVRNPQFVYEKLDNGNFDEDLTAIQQLGENILRSPDLPPKHRAIYEEFIRSYSEQTKLIRCAQEYHNAEFSKDRQAAASAYENLNQEIYGVPDEKTYRSLLGEKLGQIADKKLTGAADELRGELFQMVKFDSDQGAPERFRPSNETVEWMKGVAESLYGNMLKHVPENQANFNPNEVDSIFTEIIEQEFGEAAADWSVSVEKATVINVNLFDKIIAIPDKNMLRSREKVRSLVVHELGVHMLRAVTGGETDVFPLANGLSGYSDAEEGLGVVMGSRL